MANENRYSSTCSDWSIRSYLGQDRRHIKKLGENVAIDIIQKTALLGSARILRKVLSL